MVTSFGEIFNLSPLTLLIVLLILLLLFGGKKLPELARSLGDSVKELRKGIDGSTDEPKKDETKETAAKPLVSDDKKQ